MNHSFFFGRRWPLLVGVVAFIPVLSACGGGGSGVAVPTATPISTPGTTPTPTSIPVSGAGLLVFATAADGAVDAAQTDIFSMNPDGSNLRRLTQSAPDSAGNVQPDGSPALSPNRGQIVFVSVSVVNGQSQSQLKIMNVDGSGQRVLSSDGRTLGATVPTWSPDGAHIAFSRGNDGIYTLNADGTNVRQLTSSGANPSWSITNQIAFNAPPGVQVTSSGARPARKPRAVLPPGTSAQSEIWVVSASGTGLRQLTQRSQTATGLASINPAWSPNGQTLVSNSVPGSGVPAQLFLVNADGSNRHALGNVNGTDAVWSPTGNKIAYSGEAGLSLVNADGSNAMTLNVSDGLFVEDTDWR